MKKLTALLLALVMVCSLATTAFAADFNNEEGQKDYTDIMDKETSFTKKYDVLSGTAPDEAFKFTVAFESFVNQNGDAANTTTYPTVTIGDATFTEDMLAGGDYSEDAAVSITNIDNCALGVYTYKITETDNGIAGVNYVADPVYLNVTILRDEGNGKHYVAAIHYETVDGAKTGETTNTYEAGILEVTKKTTGNMADLTKKFPISILFKPEAGDSFKEVMTVQITNDSATTNRTYTYSETDRGDVIVTFELADAEAAYFYNIPLGTTYTVQETALYGYTQVSADGETVEETKITDNGAEVVSRTVSGVFDESNGQDSVEFKNELKSNVDTGVALDSAPYILMLVVAMAGVAALVSKKRYEA